MQAAPQFLVRPTPSWSCLLGLDGHPEWWGWRIMRSPPSISPAHFLAFPHQTNKTLWTYVPIAASRLWVGLVHIIFIFNHGPLMNCHSAWTIIIFDIIDRYIETIWVPLFIYMSVSIDNILITIYGIESWSLLISQPISNIIVGSCFLSYYTNRLSWLRLALLILLNTRVAGSLVLIGLVCSSYVTINIGTRRRYPHTPLGDQDCPSVAMGNLLASRILGMFNSFTIWFWECNLTFTRREIEVPWHTGFHNIPKPKELYKV